MRNLGKGRPKEKRRTAMPPDIRNTFFQKNKTPISIDVRLVRKYVIRLDVRTKFSKYTVIGSDGFCSQSTIVA